jgi:hypothetical protein
LLALLAAFFPLGRADGGFARLLARDLTKAKPTFARLLADGLAKLWSAGLCSFARNAMTGKAKVRLGDGNAVGKAKAEHDDDAMDYLLKRSPPFVAGLTLGIGIAKASAVAKIRIKQFLAIPLAGKVVAGPCVMAMPLFLFLCEGVAHAHALANTLHPIVLQSQLLPHLERRSLSFQKRKGS